MDVLADLASWALIAVGTFFMLVGAVGMLRLPDVFTRMHAAGMTDTMGAGLVLAGLCFQVEAGLTTVRLALAIVFLWFTSPVATHALARAVLHDRDVATATRERDGRDGGASSKP